jgi:hypothetical protein
MDSPLGPQCPLGLPDHVDLDHIPAVVDLPLAQPQPGVKRLFTGTEASVLNPEKSWKSKGREKTLFELLTQIT